MIQVLRSFPALVLALLATFLFGLGTFAGTFAITLYTFAIMTKLTYEDADAANTAAYLALRSMGWAPFPAFIHAVLPEILPSYLTNALYLLETNVRQSSILGYVGAGGIGLILNERFPGGISEGGRHSPGAVSDRLCHREHQPVSVCPDPQGISGTDRVRSKRKRHLTLLGTGILLVFFVCLAAQTPPDFPIPAPKP